MMSSAYILPVFVFCSITPFLNTFVKKEDLTFPNILFLLIFLILIGCLACNNLGIDVKNPYYLLMMMCYPLMGVCSIFFKIKNR